jgi:hypothetical protein
MRNLVVVVSGGALAFALAGATSPAVAWGSVHPADVAKAKLFMPPPTPVIRDSAARPGHPGPVTPWNEGDPPVIRHSEARPGQPGQVTIWNPPDPPVIRRAKAQPGGAARKLSAQADTPTVRDSAARMGDPDDGGQ